MSIYNGPSSESFEELKRRVDAQFEQVLSLRSDIQELINLTRMISFCLQKQLRLQVKKNDKMGP